MYILGISCYYHDSSAALLKDGKLVSAASEERFSRIKHDFSFPYNAIKFCLEYENIKGEDLNYIVFYEKPFLKFERIIKTIIFTYPKSCFLFNEVAKNWLKEKLWIKEKISDFLNIKEDKILFCKHHLSHAASSFFCSSFNEAAILTVDGVGEWATTTLGVGIFNDNKKEIKILKEIYFPYSLGLLYSVFTAFLGFKINNGEYKVMGMSAYGAPKYKDKIYNELIRVNSDGSFKLNMRYFSYHYSTRNSFNKNFIKLFGKPRKPNQRFVLSKDDFSYHNSLITDEEAKENKRFADISSSIQEVTEEILIKIANYLYKITGLKKLCIAGGVGLNCVANYKILKNTPFDEVYIQPHAGDGGGAVGACLYVWHCLLNKKERFIMRNAYWGKEYSSFYIKNFLDKNSINYKEFKDEDELLNYITDSLLEQKIVGWFQGRFEWGPRALGNRSILADPRDRKMKDKINLKIKFREPFRPFSPSVLYEHTNLIFDVEDIKNHYPFRFMLYTVPVKNDIIPAATHIDKTARPQFIEKKDNFLYYKLIENFYKKTGIPALLNTSFNLKGEPIVDSPFDALNTFRKSNLDILVIDRLVLEK